MRVYVRIKFQVSSLIVTNLTGGTPPPPPPQNEPLKNPLRIWLNKKHFSSFAEKMKWAIIIC